MPGVANLLLLTAAARIPEPVTGRLADAVSESLKSAMIECRITSEALHQLLTRDEAHLPAPFTPGIMDGVIRALFGGAYDHGNLPLPLPPPVWAAPHLPLPGFCPVCGEVKERAWVDAGRAHPVSDALSVLVEIHIVDGAHTGGVAIGGDHPVVPDWHHWLTRVYTVGTIRTPYCPACRAPLERSEAPADGSEKGRGPP